LTTGGGLIGPSEPGGAGPQLLQPDQLGVVDAVDAVDFGLLVGGRLALRLDGRVVGLELALQLGRQRLALVELGLVVSGLRSACSSFSGLRWP
jgi:hypothetical protein